MLAFILIVSLAQAAAARPAADTLKIGEATTAAELDMNKLKGEPWRLAWSPDGAELYIQTAERNPLGVVARARHYLVPAAGGAPKSIDDEPAWASKYWAWKSWKSAPGSPAFAITPEERREIIRATNPGRGAAEAGMGGDPTAGAAVGGGGAGGRSGSVIIGEGQNAIIRTMRLKGETIGEWVNAGIVPGLTFGWSPAALNLIAFSGKEKNVVIMDEQGRKQKIDTDDVTRLPAWSDDGKKLAFLEQKDRRKYVLHVVAVGS